MITITDFETGSDLDKPGFWIDGAIHANEIQATEVCLYTAWFLLEMQGENEKIREWLRQRVFYILPMMSPDSRDAHFYRPHSTSSPRSGQRPVDDDRDGLVDEDPPNDLNGDGHITQMRVRDPQGRHKAHPKYPHWMIPVPDGEPGEFTLLGTEGFDDDEDGSVNEDGDGFYDPNRDWPWNWQPSYVQGGAFRYPFSLLENRHAADFVQRHPNIAGAQSYHNAGGMLLRGPGAKQDRYEAADVRVYETIGKTGERILPGYRYLNVAEDLYEVWGGSLDWFHQMLGIFTFTNELFTSYSYFDARGETTHEFDALLLLGDGLVPWEEVDHPQYGRVEVGGLKKNWGRQPPAFMLQEECHRNMAFTLYHADQLPLVGVTDVSVKPLPGGLHEITALVRNQRLTPTHSAVDVLRKITRPDRVTISGEGLEVALGQYSSDLMMRQAVHSSARPPRWRSPICRAIVPPTFAGSCADKVLSPSPSRASKAGETRVAWRFPDGGRSSPGAASTQKSCGARSVELVGRGLRRSWAIHNLDDARGRGTGWLQRRRTFRSGRSKSQSLARAPGDVAGVAHGGADVAGVDLLVERLALTTADGIEEVADVGLLRLAAAGLTVSDQFVRRRRRPSRTCWSPASSRSRRRWWLLRSSPNNLGLRPQPHLVLHDLTGVFVVDDQRVGPLLVVLEEQLARRSDPIVGRHRVQPHDVAAVVDAVHSVVSQVTRAVIEQPPPRPADDRRGCTGARAPAPARDRSQVRRRSAVRPADEPRRCDPFPTPCRGSPDPRHRSGHSRAASRRKAALRICVPICTIRSCLRAAATAVLPSRMLWLAGFST